METIYSSNSENPKSNPNLNDQEPEIIITETKVNPNYLDLSGEWYFREDLADNLYSKINAGEISQSQITELINQVSSVIIELAHKKEVDSSNLELARQYQNTLQIQEELKVYEARMAAGEIIYKGSPDSDDIVEVNTIIN